MEHLHLIARGTIGTVNDPILGEFQTPDFPLRFSDYLEELEPENLNWVPKRDAVAGLGG